MKYSRQPTAKATRSELVALVDALRLQVSDLESAPRGSDGARELLRLLLQKPELAGKVPLAALPVNSAEARAARHLCETIMAAGGPTPPQYLDFRYTIFGQLTDTIVHLPATRSQEPSPSATACLRAR